MRAANYPASATNSAARASGPARCLACVLAALMAVAPVAGQTSAGSSKSPSSTTATGTKKTTRTAQKRKAPTKAGRAGKAARAARIARMRQAFVASTELRPMAQQLATLRSPAAYAGVTKYARAHTLDAAAAAYLALGHAYLVDRRFPEAEENLRLAQKAGQELADYADFLGAEAAHESGKEAAAETLLHGFADRYPDSIFNAQVPELEATVFLAQSKAADAQWALAADPSSAARSGYQLAQGEVDQALGQTQEAEQVFKRLLLGHPLSSEA